MPYTKHDFLRDVAKEFLEELTPDELVSELPPDKLRVVIRKAEDRLARAQGEDQQQPRPRAKTKRSSKRDKH